MPRIVLRPSFNRDLDALKRGSRKNYQRASEILQELQRGVAPSISRRAEGRIPHCVKYELADGYRLVFQSVPGNEALIALAVGTHAHVDAFLDGHKGYVFDPRTGRLKELRLATVEDTTVEIVPSDALDVEAAAESADTAPVHLFADFTDAMFAMMLIPPEYTALLRSIVDPNSLECMRILASLDDVAPDAAKLLLAFATGNHDTRDTVLCVARGDTQFREYIRSEDLSAVETSTEEFITFDDPEELESLLARGTFEQWQLFLHPDQKALVHRQFAGPARLRGISGSGKTIVALHRARRIGKTLLGTNRRVLFTTYDKALAVEAGRLLDSLCGPERKHIEVTHLHRWCLDYISFVGIPKPQFSPDDAGAVRRATLSTVPATHANALANVPREYLWSEIEFLMGRFLHEDRDQYVDTDRSGRGLPLAAAQREAVLALYESYHRSLFERGFVEPAEFVRIAYRRSRQGDPTEADYEAIIVDEVQDISELGLRLLHSVVGDRPDGLMLVGDNAQRIFTRGYSMRGIGIDISGRSVVLRKNYRNTRQILEAAFPLVRSEWEAEERAGGIDPASIRPEYSVREGHRPIFVRCRDEEHEAAFLAAEITALLRYRHYTPRAICVMARNKRYRDLALTALHRARIPAFDYRRHATGEASDDQDAVRVSSLHGAKGHEYGAVFLTGAISSVLPQPHPGDPEGAAAERALLYVAVTRARDIVYLSYSEARDTKRLARSPMIDEIQHLCDHCQYKPHADHPFVPATAFGAA